MMSKVTEYALMAFFTFVSMIVLYLIYLGLINSQKMVKQQFENEEYASTCNCLDVASVTDEEIFIRNIACNYISNLTVTWPDYQYSYEEVIKSNELIRIAHESFYKNNYSLSYSGCQ